MDGTPATSRGADPGTEARLGTCCWGHVHICVLVITLLRPHGLTAISECRLRSARRFGTEWGSLASLGPGSQSPCASPLRHLRTRVVDVTQSPPALNPVGTLRLSTMRSDLVISHAQLTLHEGRIRF